ncbi:hypothetical protein OG709_16505 [Streptomyces sp. NBC_01267]|uniref:hypothetical protein n=1 Tax=unclassified Streptomyces TaxID=2593676 RepID=UPI002024F7EE|nr:MULTISPECIES: hypothetical protein [unclassified Streptomyces]MCX4549948.1 hypothetical protein [Streptomyces sp. NBC_01500]WSC21462.1 hypothetical protein OIE60_18240 [Streptomyces sp. NBC_01766]WSV55401.1 hypothetical protein OG282_17810 [Streptomyces sp. NBC_01014]
MTSALHSTAVTLTVTVNRARHALLTSVSWADPADLGLPFAFARSEAERAATRAPEVRTAVPAKGRAARRSRSAVRR